MTILYFSFPSFIFFIFPELLLMTLHGRLSERSGWSCDLFCRGGRRPPFPCHRFRIYFPLSSLSRPFIYMSKNKKWNPRARSRFRASLGRPKLCDDINVRLLVFVLPVVRRQRDYLDREKGGERENL